MAILPPSSFLDSMTLEAAEDTLKDWGLLNSKYSRPPDPQFQWPLVKHGFKTLNGKFQK